VEHDETLTEEERASILTAEIYEYAAKTPSGPDLMPEAQLEEDTVRAAERLGLAAECGSIEPGKWADMAVFEDDPTASATISPTTRMTIVNGQIVYDSQNDSPEKWNRKIRKTVFQGE
jgi:predicted amidohydrolase YtcJ